MPAATETKKDIIMSIKTPPPIAGYRSDNNVDRDILEKYCKKEKVNKSKAISIGIKMLDEK